MRKISVSFLIVFLCTMFLAVPLCSKPAHATLSSTISKGLLWLADQEDHATGAWSLSYSPIASTAFAVMKFATYEYETADTTYNPNVTAGLHYLLSSGSSFQVDILADLAAHPGHWTGPGTPTTAGDGIGIYFRSTVGMPDVPSSTYETGIVMMALHAAEKSGFFSRSDTVPGGSDAAIAGKTYYQIMGDMVNFYAWAQNDPSSGSAEGGWRYYPNMEDPNGWGSTSDNSVSQWAALGLMTAENWSISAPSFVKSELLNHWLAYSQNSGSGGFGYTDSSGPHVPMTGAGLIELTYCDVPTSDSRWDAARSFIGNNWGSDNIGNMYAMYGVMKAAMTAIPAIVTTFGTHDWQTEYDTWLLANQNIDGSWSAEGREEAPTNILATEWALLILEKVAPPPPVQVVPEVPMGTIMASVSMMAALLAYIYIKPNRLFRRRSK
jgi:hypothetical protein